MNTDIPATMQAVQQDEAEGKLVVRELPVPRPGAGEVLVRMTAAPINPSDLASLAGLSYTGNRTYPITPGNEGSGTVVATGSGLFAKMLMGKRVACSPSTEGKGTWAQYMVTSAKYCLPLNRGVDIEQAAMLLVNPLTALAMVETAKKGKHRAIVNTAAASNLGGMILRRARHEGIQVVNIVRRAEQADVVRSRGGEYVLDSSEPDFLERLREVAQRLKATLFLDAIGGEMTQQLADAAPHGSSILIYSNMARQDSRVVPFVILVKDLRIHGWFLPNWLRTKNLLQSIALSRQAQSLLATDLLSHIGKRVPLASAQEAVESYVQGMTNHKVLFQINRE
jgi:NADPH:quinone reductase-like Zn-dependent oxidoreductase